ncbi:MAG: hypothetical protein NVS4B6_18130 [Mycobacterium sp.]
MGHDSHVLRAIRSLGFAVVACVAAAVIGFGASMAAPVPASANTVSAMTDTNAPPPSPLSVISTPLRFGIHVIEAIAQGIANAVEMIATPPPIAIPAPHTTT